MSLVALHLVSRLNARRRRIVVLKRSKKKQEDGFVVSVELLFLITSVLCVSVIAWGSVGAKIVAEWSDVGSAVGSLDQSYSVSGMAVFHANDPVHNANNPIAAWAGSSFRDNTDFCDEGCDCGVHMCIPANGPEAHVQ